MDSPAEDTAGDTLDQKGRTMLPTIFNSSPFNMSPNATGGAVNDARVVRLGAGMLHNSVKATPVRSVLDTGRVRLGAGMRRS